MSEPTIADLYEARDILERANDRYRLLVAMRSRGFDLSLELKVLNLKSMQQFADIDKRISWALEDITGEIQWREDMEYNLCTCCCCMGEC